MSFLSNSPVLPRLKARLRPGISVNEGLIYTIPIRETLAAPLPPGLLAVEAVNLDPATIQWLFASEPQRLEKLLSYAERGFRGLALHQDGHWIAMGWLSTPTTRQPDHLPRSVRGRPWLFGARIHTAFRSKGYAKLALNHLLQAQGGVEELGPTLYADVFTANTASRRSALGLGARPAGVMFTLEIPKLKLTWGLWFRHGGHPPLDAAGR